MGVVMVQPGANRRGGQGGAQLSLQDTVLGVTTGGRCILSASFPPFTLHGKTSSLCFSKAWD